MNMCCPQKRHDIKWFWTQLAISLGTGGLAAWISYDAFAKYATLTLPPLAPPAWVFPVVWTILYVLMAVSIYRVQMSLGCGSKRTAYWLYGMQLVFNFFWTMFFFTLEIRLFAFFWLIALIILVVLMIQSFRRHDPVAAWLQIPYLIWLIFAAYLNLGVYLLN